MGIGQKVLEELSSGNSFYDRLNRHTDEIEGIEEQLEMGVMPSIFRLHSKSSAITPKSPEEYLEILSLIDIKKAQPKVLKEIVDRVLGYPTSYYSVKRKVVEEVRIRSMEYIHKNKKLECSLFRAHIQILSRCTNAYFADVIKPICEEGMTNTVSLIISRVLMKSTPERVYMEEMLLSILALQRTHSVYTLLTAILIKNIQFKQETVDVVYEYILDGPEIAEQRFLAWNKVVLIFIRNYKKQVDLQPIKEMYAETVSPIEKEIEKELLS
ncbi:hypothetical protein NEMIN01_2427 [Nematocida minor]|uniref:uncharacterized protein n=1 Tax=Nematocida minor TaxID=1912983 RepID=UPI00221F4F52|nr:uncharacterized protein NEMIN01_2427 [Nematocida minor]KAI5193230.1 hypothetical protein NEMIN01_2427 [Nematocida minor]